MRGGSKIEKIILSALIASLTYLIYTFMGRSENIKVEKIKRGAIQIEDFIQKKIDRLISKNESAKKHFLKIEKMLRESSFRVGKYYINPYIFGVISIVVAGSTFNFTKGFLNNVIAAFILSGVALITPYEFLKLEVTVKRRKIRKGLPTFFLTIAQFLETTDNTIDVLDITAKEIRSPISKPFAEFANNYKQGVDLAKCTVILKSRFDNPLILRFAEDIESNIERGTQIRLAIDEYIMKAYNNEINYLERITENTANISGSIGVFGLFIFITHQVSRVNPEFINVLRYTEYGRLIVAALLVLILAGFMILKYSVSYQDSK